MGFVYDYPRPAVTADCVVIAKENEPKVLLIQRGNDAAKAQWFPISGLPKLAFDHEEIMKDAQGLFESL
jgi:hypothetical protein